MHLLNNITIFEVITVSPPYTRSFYLQSVSQSKIYQNSAIEYISSLLFTVCYQSQPKIAVWRNTVLPRFMLQWRFGIALTLDYLAPVYHQKNVGGFFIQESISLTFYARVLRKKFWCQKLQS